MFYDPRNQCFDVALMGRKKDGTFVDLLRPEGDVLHPAIAPSEPGQFPCERVLQMLLALPNRAFIPFRRGFVEHELHAWNATAAPQDQIVELYLTYYPKPPHDMADQRHIDMCHVDLSTPSK